MDRKGKKTKKQVVITFCAHNDDQIIGAGGTLAKYAKEGKVFKTYVFSYGEKSHPWLKREETVKMRVKESQKSERILGGKDIYYFGLKEGKIRDGFEERKLDKKIEKIIKENKPEKIFTHAPDDPHPDHRVVYKVIMATLDKIKYKGEVYSFGVWNPIRIKHRDKPKLVVDVTNTFKKKIKAFEAHKSQKVSLWSLLWNIYLKAIITGLKVKGRYAEEFYKIR